MDPPRVRSARPFVRRGYGLNHLQGWKWTVSEDHESSERRYMDEDH